MKRAAVQTWEIAQRDLVQRAKSKAFLATSLLVVGMILVLGPLIASELDDPPPYRVGVVGMTDEEFTTYLEVAAASFDREAVIERFDDVSAAEQDLEFGDLNVIVVDGTEVVWLEEESTPLNSIVAVALQSIERRDVAAELGLTPDEARSLLAPPTPGSRTLREPDPETEPRRIGAFIGSILLYMSILMFGQFVMMGVVEEKSSRVVEVLLSRVRPTQILVGKVIGIGLLGLAQLALLGAVVWFTLTQFDIAEISLADIGRDVIVQVVFWYLVGYTFFAVIYAALGATISRQEDMQSVALIPVALLLPGYFIALLSLEDPNATLSRVTSMLPPTSPLVMPMRLAVGGVAAWEVAVALALLAAASYGLIRLGGRVYTGAVLKLGPKVKLREAWRAAGQ
jgi:ABC-2 type transport system permease protein